MKQLINKHDRAFRLVGLENVWVERKGESPIAIGEKARFSTFIHFPMPTSVGCMECVWSGEDWDVEDYQPRKETGERQEFRDYLAALLKKKKYSASGLSMAMGYSHNWMWSVINGKRRLSEKALTRLAEELEIQPETLRRHR